MSFKLNRFGESKQLQIEQLVAYAELLGLSGSDLVAIGGKIEREKAKAQKIANMEIIRSFECLPIGRDVINEMSDRFKLKTINGSYNFYNQDGWGFWEVLSLKTKVRKTYHVDMFGHELPKVKGYRVKSRYALLLDIAAGKIQLNF